MNHVKRILLFLLHIAVPLLIIGGLVGAFRFGIMPHIERTFSLGDALASVLRRAGVTASLLIGFWVAARYYERRAITEFGFKPVAILLSAIFGSVLIGITILVLFALNNYELVSFRGFTAGLPIAVAVLIGVMIEEVIFRGVVFRICEQYFGTVKAMVSLSLIFGLVHLFNQGTSAMTAVSVTLLGVLWTLIYVYSRNLWVVIANHAAWNITIFVSGAPLSGNEHWRLSAPFETVYHGPAWMTGGGFGPEDSIINVVLLAGVVGVFWVRTRRSRCFVDGSWSSTSG